MKTAVIIGAGPAGLTAAHELVEKGGGAWLDGFPNLSCIGRNGQHRYNNMDHSMLCGMEAVRALLGNGDRSAVWNVNTEEAYHEEKK